MSKYNATQEELRPIVERGLWWLINNAEKHGQDRANAKYLESWVKTVKAQEKVKLTGLSNAAAEDAAQCSAEYRAALEAWKEAIAIDSYNTFKREAATAAIELYRTVCSNERAKV